MGDGFMLTFTSAASALRCAAAVQAHLQSAAAPLDGIRVRIGVHAGTAMSQGGDYLGLHVALAARVANAANGGETLVSQTVRDRVGADFGFGDGRSVTFKGIAEPHVVYPLAG